MNVHDVVSVFDIAYDFKKKQAKILIYLLHMIINIT